MVFDCSVPDVKLYPPPVEGFEAEPRFPPIVLVGTLVTPVAPRTAKLAKSGPSIGTAVAKDGISSAANAAITNRFKNLYFALDAVRSSKAWYFSFETFFIVSSLFVSSELHL